MRKTVILWMSAVALTMPACMKTDQLSESPAKERSLTVEATVPEEISRVTISPDAGNYKMSWDENESVKLIESNNADATRAIYTSSGISVAGGKATFTFSGLAPVPGATEYDYDLVHPAVAVGPATGSVVTLTMPSSQSPKASSVDPAAALLHGKAAAARTEQPSELILAFSHLSAYGKMNLQGLVLEGGETLTNVAITFEDCAVAGDFTFDVSDGSVIYGSGPSTITLNAAGLTTAPEGFDLWFACKPFTIAAGKKITIVSTTSKTSHTAELTLKESLAFEAGKVIELPGYSDIHTVSFDSDGGSAVAARSVKAGKAVPAPADPTKTEDIAQGLYLGNIDPDNCSYTFGGWYTDPGCTSAYDFTSPVYSDLTLYAKWIGHDILGTTAYAPAENNTIMHESIAYVNAQSLDAVTDYTLVLTGDLQFWGGVAALNNANAVVHIAGKGAERKIFSTSKWFTLISINKGFYVLEKNLNMYIAASTPTANSVIYIYGAGGVTMKDGVRLSGSSNINSEGVVVRMSNGKAVFTMEGGEISNNSGDNSQTAQATIFIANGIFTMNGGVISGNSVSTKLNTTNVAGAVALNGWCYGNLADGGRQFLKNGGEIKDNTAVRDSGAEGETTGLRGQQILLYGRGGTNDKKIDSNIDSSKNLDANSCYNWPWDNATN